MRRIVAVALLAPVMLAAAACREDEGANPSNTPALAGPPTTAAAQQRSAVHKITLKQFVRASRTALAHRRGVHLDFEMKSRRITVTGKADERLNPGIPIMRSEIATSSATAPYVDAIQTRDRMLVSLEGVMPAGKYAEIDLTATQGIFGPDTAVIAEQLDPVSAVLSNRAGFKKFAFRGPAEVYGVQMGRYQLYVDSASAMSARGVSSALQARMPKTFVYELWLDRRGLVRRIKVKIAGIAAKVEMSNWGKTVRVRMPGPEHMVSIPGLA